MTPVPLGKHERRTRVMCNLPFSTAAEEKAFAAIINYVQEQRKQNIGVTGYTFSDPSSFHGFWWSTRTQRWVEDSIVLLIVDYKIPIANPENSRLERIAQFKEIIHNSYKNHGCAQDEIWMVTHEIDRF